MCQNNSNNVDYSLLTPNTGMVTITSASSSLAGTGSVAVLTGAANGTIIKSVTIKATMATTTGMVRLFIGTGDGVTKSLFKEVPIPANPVLAATPTPAPILPMFEITLDGGFELKSGYKLFASGSNGQTFNIIAEGVNWAYPATLPPACCNFIQKTANTGVKTISTANTALDGNGAVNVLQASPAPVNGTLLKNVTIKALQSTHEGMVRLFLSADGITYFLLKEIQVPETTQSSVEPSFKMVVPLDFALQRSYFIAATTQLAESFAITVEGEDWVYGV